MAAEEAGSSTLLKDAATILPIVHLLAACFFIYSYGLGFGNRLVGFVTISDVFIVSLRVVGQVYILVGLPILLAMIVNSWLKRDWMTVVRCAIGAAASIGVMWVILRQSITPQPLTERTLPEYLSILAIFGILLSFLVWILHRSRTENVIELNARNVIGTIFVTFVLAFAFGYNKGVTDRQRHYSESAGSYFQCEDGRFVIRRIGSYFLSLAQGDRWALVDGECEVKFLIGEVPAPQAAAGSG